MMTRELPLSDALRIWDGVFAQDPTLQILDFVIAAMLLLIRNECRNLSPVFWILTDECSD
jgi:TBC1 domain family protein 5